MQTTRIETFVEKTANTTLVGEERNYASYSSRAGSVNASIHIGSPDLNTVQMNHVGDAHAHWVSLRNNQASDLVLFVHHERGSIETTRQLALALLNACAGAEAVMKARIEQAQLERHQGDLRVVTP
jgi:hypothetical protein